MEGDRIELVELPAPESLGEFLNRSFTNHAGTRTYKLYIPESYSAGKGNEVPMVVMLHGCTQSPDDFADGTQMNALAEQHGFLVVYPAQAANANGSKCWNWFRSSDQDRDRGEPSLIAGITHEVASHYRIDRRRIFVAGLSAGAAMAVILGATYPELYAAVGAHSGLPYAAAHDVPSAFSAMKGGGAPAGLSQRFAGLRAPRPGVKHSVPTIVFHGDSDGTVVASNGAAIVEATVAVTDQQSLRVSTHEGATHSGRTYSRTVYANTADDAIVEHWVLHGAGHAWSGGSRSGSFTDPSGPDASAEMIRFFYAQKRAGTA
jgi:poly(hydroxyalkanoate) depolymerase family esterase